jgi:2-iminobutanoate/2-iminopropanoate deaminase
MGTAVIGQSERAQSRQRASKAARASTKRKVLTNKAPKSSAPLSQAIVAGNTIYVSGQVPIDPETGQMVTGGFEQQAIRVFENIKAILEAAGGTMDSVVKVNVFLTDLGDFAKMNEIYKKYFKEDYPARATVGVKLVGSFQIEIECIAVKG